MLSVYSRVIESCNFTAALFLLICDFLQHLKWYIGLNKYSLIKNRATKKSFEFPGKTYKEKRKKSVEIRPHCKYSWLSECNFICYSKSNDGLFFAACVLFLMAVHWGSRASSLITQPYHNWKDIKKDVKNHCTLQYHKDSMEIL